MYSDKNMRWILVILASACLLMIPSQSKSQEVLTWSDCVAITKESNPTLKSGQEKITQAKADSKITLSGYLPNISASVSAKEQKTGVSISPYQSDLTKTFSYGITGKQLIFDGMKTPFDYESSNSKTNEVKWQYRITSADVRKNVRTAFIQLLSAQESVVITKGIMERRKKNLELVALRYKAGREHRGSLMNAEANYAQSEYEYAQAGRSILTAQSALCKEMGWKIFRPVKASGELACMAPVKTDPDFDYLTSRHPAVLLSRQQVETAGYNIQSKAAGFSPFINAMFSVGKTDNRWPPEHDNWSVGIEATLPLFEGGKTYYDLSKSRSVYRQMQNDELANREKIAHDLQQKWINLQNAVDLAGVQKKFVAAAEERAKITEAQYSIGLITFDVWSIIEDAFAQNQKNYLDSRINALTAEVNWEQAKGTAVENE